MSRDIGVSQRRILVRLHALDGDGPPSAHPLASLYDGPARSDLATFQTVRRSVHALQEKRGMVKITHRVVNGRAQVFVKLTDRGKEVISQQDQHGP